MTGRWFPSPGDASSGSATPWRRRARHAHHGHNGTLMTSSTPKVALVTGAARGIGLATAKRFLADGWRVALLDIERQLLDDAVSAIADPDRTLAVHCDVADAAAVAAAIATVQGSLRPARCADQQCRHRRVRTACWRPKTRTGTGCSPSTSRARSSAPRPPHR